MYKGLEQILTIWMYSNIMVSKKLILPKISKKRMSSFKVSRNRRVYTKGVADELVEQGCYAIDIHNEPNNPKGSDHRTRQRTSVQIGDTLYMIRGNDYWVGTVTSDWLQMPMHNGKYHPFGFFHSVKGKRKYPLDAYQDEWVCKVNWGVKRRFTATVSDVGGLKEWLNNGFNAITIKPLPTYGFSPHTLFHNYSPTSPQYSPTSPAYSPNSQLFGNTGGTI